MKKKISLMLSALILISGCGGGKSESTVPEYVEVLGTGAVEEIIKETAPPEDTDAPPPAETLSVVIEPDYDKFTEVLTSVKGDYSITGLSVALFRDGEIIHTQSLGYADRENKLPCTENTRYRIASVSKMISTMVLMTLYDNGIITPDTVLADITDIKYDATNSTEKVRLWHLLTHTAGIMDTYDYDTTATYSKTPINSLLPYAHSGSEPGTVYSYSNFGAGSIGALVERLTGKFFYDYADEVLFRPLGMDAGYLIDKISDKESCAKLYDFDGEIFDVKNWGRKAKYYDSFGLGNSYYVAQCELIITASDLTKLGIALAGGGRTDGVRILSKDAVALMNKSYFSAENFDMGLNVRIYDDLIEGRTIHGHPGNALGVITGLFYDPSDGTGIAFLTNHCTGDVDENGFYKANKRVLKAAYECFFDRTA